MSESESTLHTRPSLLMRLRDSADDSAWRTFVATYAPLLYHWCRRAGLQDADAADVSQEALLQVVRSIRTFAYQPQRGRFRDWLGLVVRRRLSRFREQRGRGAAAGSAEAEQFPEQADAAPADPEWIAEFNAQVLRVALEKIRPEFEDSTWQVFEQTWLAGRSAAEAAAQAGLSIQAAYVAKHRVLKRLEAEVLHLAEDLPQCVPLH
jgi:RNA polymerase sigma-70 factor (ECF subfamily)